MLYGHSINRRWLDRPVDPSIAVLRVDDLAGKPLGLFTNFACHSVVLGYDNLQIQRRLAGVRHAQAGRDVGVRRRLSVMVLGIGDLLLVTQPAEVFAETAIR